MSNDKFTPDATSEVDVEEALAGALAKGISVGVGQAKGQTGAVTTDFSETGHQQMSDVNVQELQSTANGLVTASMATLKSTLDSVAALRATNAAIVDNMSQLNAVHLNNLVNSASHRHSEIAADRQWNINETDAYAVILAERVAEILGKE